MHILGTNPVIFCIKIDIEILIFDINRSRKLTKRQIICQSANYVSFYKSICKRTNKGAYKHVFNKIYMQY